MTVLFTNQAQSATGRRRQRLRGGIALAVAGAMLAVAAVEIYDGRDPSGTAAAARPVTTAAVPAGNSLDDAVAAAQARLRTQPQDWLTWATLGLDYVQQAKVTVDPAYYPKADGALQRSLRIKPHGNYAALAGLGALAAGRHDFRAALHLTRRSSRIAPYNSTIYGAMADALTQLGRYGAAERAINRMMNLHPGTPSYTRLSYAEELAGHTGASRAALRQALVDAATPSDVAYVRYYLGELALSTGHPDAALAHYRAGLRADPTYPDLLQGRAKARAALGDIDGALRDYATVVRRVPQPQYLIEYGELLQSLGRTSAAAKQFALFGSEVKLFEANGVNADLEPALFYADHGDPARALRFARAGWRQRPFVDLADALGWALHRTGRDAEALRYARRALDTGVRSALFHFHAGMILRSLGRSADARAELATALRINPHFDPLRAPIAVRALDRLGGLR